MVEETVEELKTRLDMLTSKKIIDDFETAIRDLQHHGTSPSVIRSVYTVQQIMIAEHNEKYAPKPEETIIKDKKEEG